MANLYQQIILDNWKNPKNKGKIVKPDYSAFIYNPFCGDKINIYIKIAGKSSKIKDIKFEGQGCAISQAAASLLTEHLKNKTINYAKSIKKKNMEKITGITNIDPVREKCLMVSALAVKEAIKKGRIKN